MDFLNYVLKSSCIIGLFYGVYYIFMRRDTLFTAKRFYFITGFVTALVLPFITYTKTIYIDTPRQISIPLEATSFIESTPTAPIPSESISIDFWQIALIIYSIGIAIFAARLIIQLSSLLRLFKKSPSTRQYGFSFIEVTNNVSPFSFFNYIVYNPKAHTKEELQMIIAHERVHGRQWHSLDIFLSQLITIIQWANPFSYLYKKALEANLEFIADAQTVPQIESKKQYQLTLVKASSSLSAPALTSPFYQSLIKKRIIMLNKNTSRRHNLLKTLLILPLLAFFMLSFNVTEKIAYKETTPINMATLIITSEMVPSEITAIKNTINQTTVAFKVDFVDQERDASGKLTQLVIATQFSNQSRFIKNVTYGGSDQLINPIKLSIVDDQLQFSDLEGTMIMRATDTGVKALTFPKKTIALSDNMGLGDNPLYIINGREYRKNELPKSASYLVSESITHYDKKEGLEKYGAKGADGVLIFNGERNLEDKSILTAKKAKIKEMTNDVNDTLEDNVDLTNTAITKQLFKYLITKNTTEAEFEQIKNELKSKYNTEFEYAVTRNSSSEITSLTITHSDNKGNSGSYNINDNTPIKDVTFYKTDLGFGFGQVEDGERLLNMLENRRNMSQNRREQMEVRTEERMEKLEDKREHLKEKAEAMREMKKDMREHKRNIMQNNRQHNSISESIHIDHDGDKPIVIVNGKVYHGDMNAIDPNNIATVNVIKNERALIKYGEHAQNGVVEILLKNLDALDNNWSSVNVHPISNYNSESVYITKHTTNADLAAIKSEMKAKGITFNYKRVKRNANNEITGIKIDYNNGKGDKSVISKKSSSPIEDIIIEL